MGVPTTKVSLGTLNFPINRKTADNLACPEQLQSGKGASAIDISNFSTTKHNVVKLTLFFALFVSFLTLAKTKADRITMEITLNPMRKGLPIVLKKSWDPNSTEDSGSFTTNPLPQLLQTPSGLALVEMQGTINLPEHEEGDSQGETEVGRLVFPFYDEKEEGGGKGWMKAVWLYVGQHQRMTGEVKKLTKALAIVRKVVVEDGEMEVDGKKEELEIVEIVKYKILFSLRPEPVGALVE